MEYNSNPQRRISELEREKNKLKAGVQERVEAYQQELIELILRIHNNPGVSTHSPEFAQAAASEAGNKGLLDAAKALGMTIAHLLSEPEILVKIKREFNQATNLD